MKKLQHKFHDVMGSLSRLWKGLEAIKRTGPKETISVPIKEYIKLVQQLVLLLGKASDTIA